VSTAYIPAMQLLQLPVPLLHSCLAHNIPNPDNSEPKQLQMPHQASKGI
jgi:hypothetical protein